MEACYALFLLFVWTGTWGPRTGHWGRKHSTSCVRATLFVCVRMMLGALNLSAYWGSMYVKGDAVCHGQRRTPHACVWYRFSLGVVCSSEQACCMYVYLLSRGQG